MSIPSPDENFFTGYKNMILKFLWGSGRARIRYERLIQSYEKLGLKLIDLQTKDIALKASWITRWDQKSRLDKIPWLYANLPVSDIRIWECNLNVKDINNLFQYQCDMGVQILKAWSSLYFSEVFHLQTFQNVPIWVNSMIRRANKPYMDRTLLSSNVNTFEDIWDFEKNKFLDYTSFQQSHGPCLDQLKYNSIISAIPTVWRQLTKLIDKDQATDGCVAQLHTSKSPSKLFYWKIIDEHNTTKNYGDSICQLWAHDLNIDYGLLQDEWTNIVHNIRTNTNATKLRWFQYRLINRILTTNMLRAKTDHSISSLCTFCQNAQETTMHIMYECEYVLLMWRKLERWLEYFSSLKIRITKPVVIIK